MAGNQQNLNVPEVLRPVLDYIADAHLIAWDGCHRIYLALDEINATRFESGYRLAFDATDEPRFVPGYPHTLRADPDVLMATVVEWWENSCVYRFVQGVRDNPDLTPHPLWGTQDDFIPIVNQYLFREDYLAELGKEEDA